MTTLKGIGIVMILAIVALQRATAGGSSSDKVSVRLGVSVVSSMRITEADLGGRDIFVNPVLHLGQLHKELEESQQTVGIRSFKDTLRQKAAIGFVQKIEWVQMGQGNKDNVVAVEVSDPEAAFDAPDFSIVEHSIRGNNVQIPHSLKECQRGETLHPQSVKTWNQKIHQGGNKVSANSALAECVLLNTSIEDSPGLAQSISVLAQ